MIDKIGSNKSVISVNQFVAIKAVREDKFEIGQLVKRVDELLEQIGVIGKRRSEADIDDFLLRQFTERLWQFERLRYSARIEWTLNETEI